MHCFNSLTIRLLICTYSKVPNKQPVRLFRTFCYSKRKRRYCLSLLDAIILIVTRRKDNGKKSFLQSGNPYKLKFINSFWNLLTFISKEKKQKKFLWIKPTVYYYIHTLITTLSKNDEIKIITLHSTALNQILAKYKNKQWPK